MTAINSSSQQLATTPIGDICIMECQTLHGRKIIFAAVYISINQKIEDIISFLHHQLLPYSHGDAAILVKEHNKIPLVLGGDFNINFAVDNSKTLINFLEKKFSLQLNNNPNIPTTNSGTTKDAIFTRYLDNVETRTYIAYFSYHNALVTTIPIEIASNNQLLYTVEISVVEILSILWTIVLNIFLSIYSYRSLQYTEVLSFKLYLPRHRQAYQSRDGHLR
ncbi:hypothetical protein M0804_013954 [Polistes exclamans]|nr:hypothetical protein M0804_013954 [Polistes exclamans]